MIFLVPKLHLGTKVICQAQLGNEGRAVRRESAAPPASSTPLGTGTLTSTLPTGSTVSAVLAISPPWVYPVSMCNLTAPPPPRPPAQRHRCGTTAVAQRSRTAQSAAPQRTKGSIIRYLCAPTCALFSGAGTIWPRWAAFSDLKPRQNRTHTQKNLEYWIVS